MLKVKALLAKMLQTEKTHSDQLRTDSGWTTLTSASGTVKYRVIRGFVYITIEQVSANINTWTDLCTIPVSIRPPAIFYAKGATGGAGKYSITFYINPSGVVKVSPEAETTNNGFGTLIYPLAI